MNNQSLYIFHILTFINLLFNNLNLKIKHYIYIYLKLIYSMETDYDIIVLGAGSGGLTAAIGGAQIGASVLLVEKEKIGGDCTHFGCVPSKALIKLSRDIAIIRKHNFDYKVDINEILEKVKAKVDTVYSHESPDKIEKFGIKVEIGSAKFINKNSIQIGEKIYSAKKIIIATGGRARVPQVEGLDLVKYSTNKEIFIPKNFKSITIIGSGPIGSELGQAFSNLGVDVNLIERGSKIMGREEGEASGLLEDTFKKQGINIIKNHNFIKIEDKFGRKFVHISDKVTGEISLVESDEVLLSVGRVPNVEGLDLEKAEVKFDSRGIFINDKTQTSNKNIFAIGDVARGMQFTHFANHQGKVSLANIIFKLPFKYEKKVIPRVTFTNPEVASVGVYKSDLEKDGKVEGRDFFILRKDYQNIARAITDDNENGFFKIIVDKKGFILGSVLVGAGSGELIGEISLAMKNKIKITKLADTIHPYPTYGYGLRNCADQFRSFGFSENKKKWIKRIFGLRGN